MLVIDDSLVADIEIDKNQVCQYIGYEDDQNLSARISSLIDDYAEHAHSLINPLFSYVIKDVEWARGSIALIKVRLPLKAGLLPSYWSIVPR
jgi:hypothetical protein